MFGYLEYDEIILIKTWKKCKIPIVDKWTKLMIDCFNPFPNNEENNSWVMMDEIFLHGINKKIMSSIKKIEVFFLEYPFPKN